MDIVYLTGSKREKCLNKLIQMDENILAIIVPLENKNREKYIKFNEIAKESKIPIHQLARNELFAIVEKYKPDLLISVGYPYIITEKTLKIPKYAINVHPTLLPKYAGALTGAYVLINGESETGVTVHHISKDVDAGDIIIRKKVKLDMFDTVKSIMSKTSKIEPNILYEAVQMLKNGNAPRIPQNRSNVIEYKNRTPEDSEIDWNKPLKSQYNKIRACDPEKYPAFFYINEEKVYIKLWRKKKIKDDRI